MSQRAGWGGTFSKPVICGICHKSGHRPYECPKRSDAGAAVSSASPVKRSIQPCWSCGELHYASACPVRADRMQKGVCLLCGSDQHWVRECHRYAETMGANPRSSAPVTAVRCLRCGTDDHCTAKCAVDGAPIHEPEGGQAQYGVCLWCGIRGHNYCDCLRRVPETLAQEQQKSSALRDEFDTHKASAAGHAQDIATLKSQVASLQSAVAPLPEMKRDLESLTSRVQGLMQWRSAQEKPSADMKKSLKIILLPMTSMCGLPKPWRKSRIRLINLSRISCRKHGRCTRANSRIFSGDKAVHI